MATVHEPTVVGVSSFNAAEDAAALRAAMKGFGTDEDAIIEILTSRSNAQRQAISKAFTHEYGRDLIDDLKSELGGHFEDVIVALMLPPAEYLCKELHHCMEGMGTDENLKLMKHYITVPLAEHMCSETSGDFRRLLTLIVTGARDEEAGVDAARAAEAAQQLYDAGEGKWGTDEEIFNKILAHESFGQLRAIFEEYKNISGRTIEQAIKAEISGELADALSAIVECVENAAAWFASRLRSAMQGGGTEDKTLIRIIVNRSEIDLAAIKREYESLYDKTLQSDVAGETSGDYRKALIALLGPA
ncbi:unnamed protein product [Leptosia nina]|uniref:Annexin n=1 Tax=Leptosia nina TaxID=320188 RepID=A0AAV1JRL8_9NEOP